MMSDSALDLTRAGYWLIDYSDPDYYTTSERAATIFGEHPTPDYRYHLMDEWAADRGWRSSGRGSDGRPLCRSPRGDSAPL